MRLTAHPQAAPRRDGERGIALVTALMVLVVIGVLTAVVMQTATDETHEAETTRDRASAETQANSAIDAYRFLLNAGLVGSDTAYVPSRAALQRALAGSDATVVSASAVPAELRSPLPGGSPISDLVTVADGSAFWQVAAVLPPGATSSNVGIWLRSWTANERSRRVRYTFVEYAPGTFASYQLLVNEPLGVGANLAIEGQLHVNGYGDGLGPGGTALWATNAGSQVSCLGTNTRITVSRGSVAGVAGSCSVQTGAPTVNFVQVRSAIGQLRERCTTGTTVRCFSGGAGWRVSLSGATARVYRASTLMATMALGSSSGLVFDGDVDVSGTTTARVTIAASRGNGSGGARIRIIGDVGSATAAREGVSAAQQDEAVLGLVAQGDIVVDPSSASCDLGSDYLYVRAALVAQNGTLTVDRASTTQQAPGGSRFQCSRIVLEGALAAQEAPVLRWNWSPTTSAGGNDLPEAASWFGFRRRDFRFDGMNGSGGQTVSRLSVVTPPFFPIDGQWDVRRVRNGDADCIPGAAASDAPTCAT